MRKENTILDTKLKQCLLRSVLCALYECENPTFSQVYFLNYYFINIFVFYELPCDCVWKKKSLGGYSGEYLGKAQSSLIGDYVKYY